MFMAMRGTASILSNAVLLLGVMSSFGRHNHSFCYGYQLVINNTAPGAYYQNITNIVVGGVTTEEEDAVEVIGALYQNVLYDNKGNRLDHTLHQGYVMYSKEDLVNYNDIYYFQDDDGTVSTMNVFNSYIMSANGTYTHYSGGTISLNALQYTPAYIAEVTLVEPPLPSPTTTDTDADETMTLRITNEGGWTEGINQDDPVADDDANDGRYDDVSIGLRFQDNIIHTDGTNNTVMGINTGFLYRFPKLDGIDTYWNTNRKITMRDNDSDGDTDGTILIFNDVIVYATGKYSQFVGPVVVEDVVPVTVTDQQPYFIVDMTLSKSTTTDTQNPPFDNDVDDDDDDDDGSYNFIIKSEGGFLSSIDDVLTGDPIGERFQNPIIDLNGKRIGTQQAYSFNFPMPAAEFDLTTTLFQANRRFFFHDGSIIEAFNDYIVSASGNYTKYQGGQLSLNVISDSPKWVAEVTLIPSKPKPKTTTNTDNNNDSNEDEGDKKKNKKKRLRCPRRHLKNTTSTVSWLQ